MKNAMTRVLVLFLSLYAGWAAAGVVADVSVYDRAERRALPVYQHEGRYYVVGRPGNEYQVTVRNKQPGEILAVISVDGVNAVSGETANWEQTGYVLSPYSSYSVKGWRKSTQRTAAFFFTELENSYAARTGRPDHVGVIGVAVFRAKAEPVAGLVREHQRRSEAPAAGAAAENMQRAERDGPLAQSADRAAPAASRVAPQPAEKSIGTGHGRSESSVVSYTNFERASSQPDEVITIYYDSHRNLVARGVIPDATRIARPQPFPGQFVPDPR